jgi:hypothetical protein
MLFDTRKDFTATTDASYRRFFIFRRHCVSWSHCILLDTAPQLRGILFGLSKKDWPVIVWKLQNISAPLTPIFTLGALSNSAAHFFATYRPPHVFIAHGL